MAGGWYLQMSQRTEQVASLLVTEVSTILSRDLEAPRDSLITIMRATVSPDLKNATLFVSVLPENKRGTTLTILKHKTSELQRILQKRMSMKFVPRLRWEIDLTTSKYAAIDEALNNR